MKLDPQVDYESLCRFAMNYHASAPAFFGTLNIPKMAERIAVAVLKHESFVIKNEDQIIGAIVLDEVPSAWWSDDTQLTDLFFCIHPSFRTFANVRGLLREADEYAKMKGKELHLTLFNPFDMDRKETLMKRLGFKQITASFIGGAI